MYNYEEAIFSLVNYRKTKTYTRDFYIKNLVENDINNDGNLDLLVTVYNLWTKVSTFEVHLFDPSKLEYNVVFSRDSTGVIVGDFDGDR